MKYTYQELSELKAKCKNQADRTVMEWAAWVEYMLGSPEMYEQFIILDRNIYTKGMYLTNNGWCNCFDSARRYSWKEAAVLITENRKLEAIRFENGIAVNSEGIVVGAE